MRLILDVADQANLSPDTEFAVRTQVQVGLLVCLYDRDRARLIFRRAMGRLFSPDGERHGQDTPDTFDAVRRHQLGVECLNQVAGCDPELAEILARSMVLDQLQSVQDPARPHTGHFQFSLESRELLVSVALSIAASDRERAFSLAQLSLAGGVSPYLDRLLMQLADGGQNLADQLFCDAVEHLERSAQVSLKEVHTLMFYLISDNAAARTNRLTDEVIVRFLRLSSDLVIPGHGNPRAEEISTGESEHSFEFFYTLKYLMELSPRYLPERTGQLKRRFAQISKTNLPEAGLSIQPARTSDSCSSEPADAALDENQRDQRYAQAALDWLSYGCSVEAQKTTLKITDVQTRDRILAQVARRLMIEARVDEAGTAAHLLHDQTAKTEALIALARAELARRNGEHAIALLTEAECEAADIDQILTRAQLLLEIVSGFSPLDPGRAFAAMQEATEALNQLAAYHPEASASMPGPGRPVNNHLFDLGLGDSLTALARLDFDRALSLAQKLTGREATLIARLAVYRAGLTPDRPLRGETK
jgi:hypothetical protein